MIVEIAVFLLTTLLGYLLYLHKSIHNFFDEKGVKYLPGIPIFGNIFRSTFLKSHVLDDLDTVYRAFPNEKYVGYIEGTTPIFLIRDPEIIKNITIKDFDHFTDHRMFFSEETNPLFGGSLIMMKGEKWHDMRTTLSPAFTGSKMRRMMPFMTEIGSNIIQYLKDHIDEDIDIEDLVRRYTSDVIASAGFGLQVNSLKDKDNEFYKTGQNVFTFTPLQRFYLFFSSIFPKLANKLGIQIFPKQMTTFFRNLVTNTMEHREKNKIERPDMIQLLMEASKAENWWGGSLEPGGDPFYPEKRLEGVGIGNVRMHGGRDKIHTSEAGSGSLKAENEGNDNFTPVEDTFKPKAVQRQWTHNELAGQVFIFFVAGYESSATALAMCIHELALHHGIQEKLFQEIVKFKEAHGNISYENIGALKYLDCVISETNRRWAAALIMDRVCNKPYELPPPRKGAKPVQLNPGDIVYNLVNSLHMDPAYHPEPEKFDPERFSDENKHKIQPFTYMPFGMGPRNCIGSRFALMELKVLIYNIVLNFKIMKCAKTTDPIELKPHEFNIKPKGGCWVRLVPRN